MRIQPRAVCRLVGPAPRNEPADRVTARIANGRMGTARSLAADDVATVIVVRDRAAGASRRLPDDAPG